MEQVEKLLCNRLNSMKSIEVHVVSSPHDLELAQSAGLLDENNTPMIVTCGLCQTLILLPTQPNSETPQAHIVLSDEEQTISCNLCLGLALQTFMLYI